MIASLLSALWEFQAGLNVWQFCLMAVCFVLSAVGIVQVICVLHAPKPEIYTEASEWRTPEQEMREQDVHAAMHIEQLERRRLHGLTHANLVPFRPHHDDRRVN